MSRLIQTLLVIQSLTVCLMSCRDTTAQVREFPYRATVEVPEVYVRSGGGEQFFATQKLVRGDEVTVHQHHAGGWFQIEPPKGSFSWIPQRYVETQDEQTGRVKLSGVVAYVGSDFGKDISVFQRKMNANEAVEILAAEVIETTRGPEPMYKIRSPKREWRWVPGQAVVPVDQRLRQQRDADPYVVPSAVDVASADPSVVPESSGVTDVPDLPNADLEPSQGLSVTTSQQLKQRRQVRQLQQRLSELDTEFRSILAGETSDWRFGTVEAGYDQLKEDAAHPAFNRQIRLRISAIRKYERIKSEYDDFIRLTTETERRDAQLLAAQFGVAPSVSQDSVSVASTDDIPFGSFGAPETRMTENQTVLPPIAAGPFQGSETTLPSSVMPDASISAGTDSFPLSIPALDLENSESDSSFDVSQGDPRSQFVGAGVLQKAAKLPGKPEYVLLNPAGKILAYVEGVDSVNLEEHLGNAVGLHGKRFYRDDISADYIEISGLQPVKIRR